jgi:hypothetical protein
MLSNTWKFGRALTIRNTWSIRGGIFNAADVFEVFEPRSVKMTHYSILA